MSTRQFLRTLTIGEGAILVPHIDRFLASNSFPEEWVIRIRNYKEHDPYFHPSGDCLRSNRDLWLDKLDKLIHRKITAQQRKTFDAGHMWHGYYGSILAYMGLIDPSNVERSLTLTKSGPYGIFTMRGTGDLVGVRIPGHGEWLVDMKTMRSGEFEAGATRENLAKWSAQVNVYGDWFGYDKLMILAIQKDTPHALREYIIERDRELVDNIYTKWSYVQSCIESGKEPSLDLPSPQRSSADATAGTINTDL